MDQPLRNNPPGSVPVRSPAPPPEPAGTVKGVKETIESILIAFILAFVFRAFVVEAFVIPTGSMAPTLLGAHMRFNCEECGYTFDVNFPTRTSSTADDIDIPSQAGPVVEEYRDPYGGLRRRLVDRVFTVHCPNCRHKLPSSQTTNPPVRYGDRILVLKYIYIPWISSPSRWDVVVFKNPTDVNSKPSFSQNYIKRLIGLPGEQVIVLDGDVYVKTSKDDDTWEVQTKPRYAQDALWRIVYDNDHRPLEENREDHWRLPWIQSAGSGWDTGNKQNKTREFKFDNGSGAGTLTFDSTADPRYFTDWLAYDATMGQVAHFTVSDLKLTFYYQRHAGDGVLQARMTKYDHEFVAELAGDTVRLIHRLPDGTTRDVAPARPLKAGNKPVRVDLQNVDYRVTLRIDDEVAFETTANEYQPDVQQLFQRHYKRRDVRNPPPTIRIEASRQKLTLSHISLWRDVYYTPEDVQSRSDLAQGKPDRPVELGPDEYFVMGDNSAASWDARFWPNEVDLPGEDLHAAPGRVPGRFLLGKAFFVYWPAGYRPISSAPAIVPNFGDMRLIH